MEDPQTTHFEQEVGDALVAAGFLAAEQLERAQEASGAQSGRLLETLLTLGLVARGTLLTMMGLQLRVPVEDLQNSNVAAEAVKLLPQEVAREHRVVPLALEADGSLRLAVSRPQDRQFISRLASITGRRIRVVLALGGEIDQLIDSVYQPWIEEEPQGEPAVFYEGSVGSSAQYAASLQTTVEFVQQLRDIPRLRLLRLARQATNDVRILLRLQQPMDLKAMLERMPGVAEVSLVSSPQPEDGEPQIIVRLLDTIHNPSNQ